MKADFKIKDSIYLISGDHEIDLHNGYNFRAVKYSIDERKAILLWERGDGGLAGDALPAFVEIEFQEIVHFEFKPRDPEMPFSEDDCISSIGYWADEDWCDGIFSAELDPDPEWYTAFEFMSGATIFIKADEAHVAFR
jgi:hypothetical protein